MRYTMLTGLPVYGLVRPFGPTLREVGLGSAVLGLLPPGLAHVLGY